MKNPSDTYLVTEGKMATGATSPASQSSTGWNTVGSVIGVSPDLAQTDPKNAVVLDTRHGGRNIINNLHGDYSVRSVSFKNLRGTATQELWDNP